MKFIQISTTQFLNLEQVTRIEVFHSGESMYTTVHLVGGGSYRCTEDESEKLLPFVTTNAERAD